MPAKHHLKAPTLSLCIPSYNRADDIIQVLKDLQQQTVPPYEIVVNDDCSDEKDVKKIKAFLKTMPQVKWYENKKNKRLAGNCNEAVKRAKGEYVSLVNNDDRVSPRYVELILKSIQQYPGYNAYMTNAIGITEEKQIVGDYRLIRKNGVIEKKTGIRHLYNYYFLNLISISGATFYKTSYIKSVLFDERYGNEADLDFALKMLATIDIMYIDLPIYFVRMHSDSTSRKIRLETDRLIGNITNCMKIFRSYKSHKKQVPLYIERVQAMYVLQLLYKYRFSVNRVKKILKISSNRELIVSTLMIFWLVGAFSLRKLSVTLHRPNYVAFSPEDIQTSNNS